MATPYQTAARAARSAFYSAAGETVVYARDGSSVSVSAVRLDDGEGTAAIEGVNSRTTDIAFFIAKADLVLDGEAVSPQRGDTITDANGLVYDVQDGWDRLDESAEYLVPVQEVN